MKFTLLVVGRTVENYIFLYYIGMLFMQLM